jgi:endonuclease/exonuclease/phosphatase (EEP) superfamily protein YafD
LAIVLTFVGLGGAVWPKADFLNQFAPVWALAGLASLTLLALGRRSRRPAAAAAAALLLAAGAAALMGPDLAARAGRHWAQTPHQVRIVQFNVWKGNRSASRAADWVLAQDPDIVVLEEAANRGEEVARRLAPSYPFRVTCRGARSCSTVILSRRPPVASEGLARGDAENRKALSAAWARYDFGGRGLTVFAVHLSRPWPWGGQEEDRRKLIAEVRRLPDQNLIVLGDFNTTPWTFAGKRQDEALQMNRITRALFTWPLYYRPRVRVYPMIPIMPIDQAYLRPGLLPVAVRSGPELGSDHRPVVIDLAWALLRDQPIAK